MKNGIFNVGVMAVFISIMLTSCNGSVKGKWSDSDKQKFRTDMEGVEELSDLGDKKAKLIECYLNKCEANYSSYSEADKDEPGCEKLAIECGQEIQ